MKKMLFLSLILCAVPAAAQLMSEQPGLDTGPGGIIPNNKFRAGAVKVPGSTAGIQYCAWVITQEGKKAAPFVPVKLSGYWTIGADFHFHDSGNRPQPTYVSGPTMGILGMISYEGITGQDGCTDYLTLQFDSQSGWWTWSTIPGNTQMMYGGNFPVDAINQFFGVEGANVDLTTQAAWEVVDTEEESVLGLLREPDHESLFNVNSGVSAALNKAFDDYNQATISIASQTGGQTDQAVPIRISLPHCGNFDDVTYSAFGGSYWDQVKGEEHACAGASGGFEVDLLNPAIRYEEASAIFGLVWYGLLDAAMTQSAVGCVARGNEIGTSNPLQNPMRYNQGQRILHYNCSAAIKAAPGCNPLFFSCGGGYPGR